jgi:DMSO/TMAO reductase YedYZ molybdopterin-dependent catalytic subunit
MAQPKENAQYATIICDGGYTTSLPLSELLDDDVLFVYNLDGKELEPKYGGPLRLVVPKKYAYKSAKWVRKVRFTQQEELGYWEVRGYSNTADPWTEDRYS